MTWGGQVNLSTFIRTRSKQGHDVRV